MADTSSSSSYFSSILTKPPPLDAFDAFKKTNATYKQKTEGGGLLTLVLAIILGALVWTEAREYLYGDASYEFSVDRGIAHDLQLNLDATVAMPCHYLTVDVRDAVGDRLHISDEFKKDGTTFEIGQAKRIQNLKNTKEVSASKMIHDAHGRRVFPATSNIIENGPACRIYGSMAVKKVTGNLHITTLGHGYLSWEHTDHKLMNLSHVIHEFSFGPYFPRIAQPLDNSAETTDAPFHIFQYFVSVVSTTYIDARRRVLHTSQYSVTDMSRVTEHGKGVPGVFIKYDIEPMALTIRERTTTLLQFLVRLAGIVGGILVCSDFGFRTFNFMLQLAITRSSPAPLPVKSPMSSKANERAFAVKKALEQLEPTREVEGDLNARSKQTTRDGTRHKSASSLPPVANSPWVSWLVEPAQSLRMILVVTALWAGLEHLKVARSNPLTPFLFISYKLAPSVEDGLQKTTHYGKGPLDLCFLAFYIVVFSCLRQSLTEYILRPFAKSLGLKSESKVVRFMEQSYAIVYFTASGLFGLYVMSSQKSWWYRTEHLWLEYPHWRMRSELKAYYLLQLQVSLRRILLAAANAGAHSSVDTLNLTMIGTCIFMSKCINYLDYKHVLRSDRSSYSYMRHYLNIRILYSVWNEFDLIPEHFRSWAASPEHPNGWWLFYERGSGRLPAWMKYQIFAPILALQLVNTFWSALIWRILIRILSGEEAKDVREEGEDSDDEVEAKKKR
ncbi:hypothetical protein OIO90_003408 [Microbotryomycetes sp. JL221]|nr:hypothetical protein OIO90_003408 [Microbotryomycetes sp. JL221]